MSESAPQKSNTGLFIAIGCGVMLLGLILVGVFAAFAIPDFLSHQYETQQAEAKLILTQIQQAEIVYEAEFGTYLEIEPYPPEPPTKKRQQWFPEQSGAFQKLKWTPVGQVHSVYSVTTTPTDFRAIGVSDIDGDGVYATYVATKSTVPYAITAPGVY